MKLILALFFLFATKFLYAQEVVGIEMSNCDTHSDPECMIPTRLISKRIENDTLYLQFGLVRNCSYFPSVCLVKKGDTLFIDIENNSEIISMCDCCYEATIKVVGIADTNFRLIHKFDRTVQTETGKGTSTFFYEFKTRSSKYFFPSLTEVEQLPATNIYNNDSLRIGAWHIYDKESQELKAKVLYDIDENGKSIVNWYCSYDQKGEINEVCAQRENSDGEKIKLFCISKTQFYRINGITPK